MTQETTPEKALELKDRAFIGALLTGPLNLKGAYTVAGVEGIEFKKGDGYKAAKADLTEDSIKQVKITAPGKEPRYFKQVAKVDDASEPSQDVTPTGFKAIAWVETDATGTILPDKDNKANVIVTFSGWDGIPNDGKPQTESMYVAGDGGRYPQMDNVPAFMKQVDDILQKDNINPNYNIVGHSLGAGNALKAATDLEKSGDNKAASVLLLEPVSASNAAEHLAEDGPIESVLEKTDSIRSVTRNKNGELIYSKAAQLQSPDAPPDQTTFEEKQKTRTDNIARSTNPFAPHVKKIHPKNELAGNTYLMDVTGIPTQAISLGARLDPIHALGSIANAARIEKTPIGSVQEIQAAARAAVPQKGKALEKDRAQYSPAMERALERIDKMVAKNSTLLSESISNPFDFLLSTLKSVMDERAILQASQMIASSVHYTSQAIESAGTQASMPKSQDTNTRHV